MRLASRFKPRSRVHRQGTRFETLEVRQVMAIDAFLQTEETRVDWNGDGQLDLLLSHYVYDRDGSVLEHWESRDLGADGTFEYDRFVNERYTPDGELILRTIHDDRDFDRINDYFRREEMTATTRRSEIWTDSNGDGVIENRHLEELMFRDAVTLAQRFNRFERDTNFDGRIDEIVETTEILSPDRYRYFEQRDVNADHQFDYTSVEIIRDAQGRTILSRSQSDDDRDGIVDSFRFETYTFHPDDSHVYVLEESVNRDANSTKDRSISYFERSSGHVDTFTRRSVDLDNNQTIDLVTEESLRDSSGNTIRLVQRSDVDFDGNLEWTHQAEYDSLHRLIYSETRRDDNDDGMLEELKESEFTYSPSNANLLRRRQTVQNSEVSYVETEQNDFDARGTQRVHRISRDYTGDGVDDVVLRDEVWDELGRATLYVERIDGNQLNTVLYLFDEQSTYDGTILRRTVRIEERDSDANGILEQSKTEWTYDELGRILDVWNEKRDDRHAPIREVVRIKSTYDESGMSKIRQIDLLGDGVIDSVPSEEYFDPSGRLLLSIFRGPSNSLRTTNSYSEQGRTSKSETFKGIELVNPIRIVEIKSNAADQVLSEETRLDDNADGIVDSLTKSTKDYDEQGNLVESSIIRDLNNDGKPESAETTIHRYDNLGQTVSTMYVNIVQGVIRYTDQTTYHAEAPGSKIRDEYTTRTAGGRTLVLVDRSHRNGQVVRDFRSTDRNFDAIADTTSIVEHGYDERGRRFFERLTRIDGNPTRRQVNETWFDLLGRPLRESTFIDRENDGTTDIVTYEATYDPFVRAVNHSITRSDLNDDGKADIVRQVDVTYSQDGMQTSTIVSVDNLNDRHLPLIESEILYDHRGNIVQFALRDDTNQDGVADTYAITSESWGNQGERLSYESIQRGQFSGGIRSDDYYAKGSYNEFGWEEVTSWDYGSDGSVDIVTLQQTASAVGVSRTTAVDANRDGRPEERREEIRDPNNRIVSLIQETDSDLDGLFETRAVNKFQFDAAGRETRSEDILISAFNSHVFVREQEFDLKGNMTRNLIRNDNDGNGEFDQIVLVETTYDDRSRPLIEITKMDDNGDQVYERSSSSRSTYDELGFLAVYSLDYDGDGVDDWTEREERLDNQNRGRHVVVRNDFNQDRVMDAYLERIMDYNAEGRQTLFQDKIDKNLDGVVDYIFSERNEYHPSGLLQRNVAEFDENGDGVAERWTGRVNTIISLDDLAKQAGQLREVIFKSQLAESIRGTLLESLRSAAAFVEQGSAAALHRAASTVIQLYNAVAELSDRDISDVSRDRIQVVAHQFIVSLGETGTGSVPRDGDLDSDGVVGFLDFLTLSFHFDRDDEQVKRQNGDMNADGRIDFSDFLILSEHFDGP